MYGYSMVKHIEGLGYKVEENTLFFLFIAFLSPFLAISGS